MSGVINNISSLSVSTIPTKTLSDKTQNKTLSEKTVSVNTFGNDSVNNLVNTKSSSNVKTLTPLFHETPFNEATEVMKAVIDKNGMKNKPWNAFVDMMMKNSLNKPEDALPPIDTSELQDMKAKINSGDIIMTGNNGAFIHGIMYVGKDAELQSKLEQKWNLPKGSLDNEGLIIHALNIDESKEVEFNGKKQFLQAAGEGVVVDTIERYTKRSPTDLMIAVSPKEANDSDRSQAIANMKSYVGKPYDRYFDTFDTKAMYCTEAVSDAWTNTKVAPDLKTENFPLVEYPNFLKSIMPKSIQSGMQDEGILHNEMIMTEGIATSKSMNIAWTSKNADKSEFVKKLERFDNAYQGKGEANYRENIMKDFPYQAEQSKRTLEAIKKASSEQ